MLSESDTLSIVVVSLSGDGSVLVNVETLENESAIFGDASMLVVCSEGWGSSLIIVETSENESAVPDDVLVVCSEGWGSSLITVKMVEIEEATLDTSSKIGLALDSFWSAQAD
jgi:hypothetical protein